MELHCLSAANPFLFRLMRIDLQALSQKKIFPEIGRAETQKPWRDVRGLSECRRPCCE
jgi:hypothetical protein